MIKQSTPLTMAEVMSLAGETEKETKLKGFIEQFIKRDKETAEKLKDELKNLSLIKLKDENLVKIVDFEPEDASDLIKILPNVSLNQDEIAKILEIVKKY